MKNASVRQSLSMEPLLFPLSSRAQPRDLRFYGPFVEMFFDRAEGPAVLRTLRGNVFRWSERLAELLRTKGFIARSRRACPEPAEGTSAMHILLRMFRAFQPPRPENVFLSACALYLLRVLSFHAS